MSPDYDDGWDWVTDGGGEQLRIDGFGISLSAPAISGASSTPGLYCASTGGWNVADCSGGGAGVNTFGIQAEYEELDTQAVPAPSMLWLISSGLLGLVGMARRKKAA
jgi:hypothetical protein